MDKRTLFAMFLVIIIFVVLQTYVFKPQPAQPEQDQTAVTDSIDAAADSIPTAELAQSATIAAIDSLFKPASQSTAVTLSNDKFNVRFSTLGASITSVELNEFTWAGSDTLIELVPADRGLAGLRLLGRHDETDLTGLNWQHDPPDSGRVVFWLGDKANPLVKKTFSLDDEYGILMDVEVQSPNQVNGIEYDFSAGIADSEKIKPRYKDSDYKLLLFAENNLEKISLSKIKKENIQGSLNSFKWIAARTKYFTIA
ncbi:MAG: membrane protein insertase YidC, partial [Candidatus Syntrophosphaera sp.]